MTILKCSFGFQKGPIKIKYTCHISEVLQISLTSWFVVTSCWLAHFPVSSSDGPKCCCWPPRNRRSEAWAHPVLASLHWLPVSCRIHFKILLLAYKALNKLAPSYLSDFSETYVPSQPLRSADQLPLVAPNVRLKNKGDRPFCHCSYWTLEPAAPTSYAGCHVAKSRLV